MAIFNSYVGLPEGKTSIFKWGLSIAGSDCRRVSILCTPEALSLLKSFQIAIKKPKLYWSTLDKCHSEVQKALCSYHLPISWATNLGPGTSVRYFCPWLPWLVKVDYRKEITTAHKWYTVHASIYLSGYQPTFRRPKPLKRCSSSQPIIPTTGWKTIFETPPTRREIWKSPDTDTFLSSPLHLSFGWCSSLGLMLQLGGSRHDEHFRGGSTVALSHPPQSNMAFMAIINKSYTTCSRREAMSNTL